MGEKYLRTLLLDFMLVRFGLGKLNERFLAKQDKPFFYYLALQPTSDCNAKPRCPGCYAEGSEGRLDYETLDRTLQESMTLASRLTIIAGGEPLLEKDNLLRLFRKYKRMPFLVATNGKLLDESYAKQVTELGNVITFINIPGLESTAIEIRQDPNVWNEIKTAAENLKKYRAACGFVSTVYQANFKEVSSPEFVEQMLKFGMMLGFYFPYMDPVGCSPQKQLALTPQMNEEFSQRVQDVSSKYPLFLIDASGGREKLIGGCPAGRRGLIHIQSNGNVAGCPMVPQLDSSLNVNEKSLGDILKSPYFEIIRKGKFPCLRSPEALEALADLANK